MQELLYVMEVRFEVIFGAALSGLMCVWHVGGGPLGHPKIYINLVSVYLILMPLLSTDASRFRISQVRDRAGMLATFSRVE